MTSTKVCPQPSAWALRIAISRSASSFPSARVKHAPELSLNASPNLACGTAVHTASYKSSTVLMKCDWPTMILASSGNSMRTALISSMAPPLLCAGKLLCAAFAFGVHSPNVTSCLHFYPHYFVRADEQRHLNPQAVLKPCFFPGRFLLCMRRGRCFGNTDFGDLWKGHTEWLTLKELHGQLHSRSQELFHWSEHALGHLELLKGLRAHKRECVSRSEHEFQHPALELQLFEALLRTEVRLPDMAAS